MKDGIHHVQFSSSLGGAGAGLVVAKDGSLNGGDVGYLYQGTLSQSGDRISGTLQVLRWNLNTASVFCPIDYFQLQLSGAVAANDSLAVEGGVPSGAGLGIRIQGSRLVDAAQASAVGRRLSRGGPFPREPCVGGARSGSRVSRGAAQGAPNAALRTA